MCPPSSLCPWANPTWWSTERRLSWTFIRRVAKYQQQHQPGLAGSLLCSAQLLGMCADRHPVGCSVACACALLLACLFIPQEWVLCRIRRAPKQPLHSAFSQRPVPPPPHPAPSAAPLAAPAQVPALSPRQLKLLGHAVVDKDAAAVAATAGGEQRDRAARSGQGALVLPCHLRNFAHVVLSWMCPSPASACAQCLEPLCSAPERLLA